MMTSRISVAAAFAVILMGSTSVMADCVLSGTQVNCTGSDLNGFSSGTPGLTVTVQPGAVVSGGRALDLGANINITNNGTLDGIGNDGIRIGSGTTVTNNGLIRSNADEAIEADAANNVTIINTGTIITTATGDKAIEAVNNLRVVNSGLIESTSSEAIEADGAGLYVLNTGTIRAYVDDAVDGNADTTIINHGTIIGGQNDAVELDNGIVINTGTIISTSSSPGEVDAGVDFDIGAGTVINSGLIQGEVAIDTGAGSNAEHTIVNSGRLIGTGGTSMRLGGGNDSLTVLRGSIIVGTIDLGTGTDRFHVGSGLAGVFNFASAPEIVTTDGSPVAISGNRVAVYETSGMAARASAFDSLSTSIADLVLRDVTRGAGSPAIAAGNGLGGPAMRLGKGSIKDDEVETSDRRGFAWGRAFGAHLSRDAGNRLLDTRSTTGGFAVGYDWASGGASRTGVFVGGASQRTKVDFDLEESTAGTLYGGAYQRWSFGNFALGAMLSAGATQHEGGRTVVNNAAPGGVERAEADYSSAFVNPALEASVKSNLLGLPLMLTARGAYAGLFQDSYAETGSAAAARVHAADMHLLQGRLQARLDFNRATSEGSLLTFSPFVGVKGWTRLDDGDMQITLIGQDVVFNPGGEKSAVTPFAGIAASVATSAGFDAFADLEAAGLSDDATEYKGRIGARWRW